MTLSVEAIRKQAARRQVMVSPECHDLLQRVGYAVNVPVGKLILTLIEAEAGRLGLPRNLAEPVDAVDPERVASPRGAYEVKMRPGTKQQT